MRPSPALTCEPSTSHSSDTRCGACGTCSATCSTTSSSPSLLDGDGPQRAAGGGVVNRGAAGPDQDQLLGGRRRPTNSELQPGLSNATPLLHVGSLARRTCQQGPRRRPAPAELPQRPPPPPAAAGGCGRPGTAARTWAAPGLHVGSNPQDAVGRSGSAGRGCCGWKQRQVPAPDRLRKAQAAGRHSSPAERMHPPTHPSQQGWLGAPLQAAAPAPAAL